MAFIVDDYNATDRNAELTVLYLVQDGDRILLQNRVKNDWQGYTLPGGHVEHEENAVTCYVD